jgi:hypothetical protein
VATDAVVGPSPLGADGRRQAATSIGVALQAAIPEVGRIFLRLRKPMRIVACDAPKAPLACLEAATLAQLLELADETVFDETVRTLEYRPEALKGQSRPKVLIASACAQDAFLPVQVALLADGIPECGLQFCGIHDRHGARPDRGTARNLWHDQRRREAGNG